MVNWKLKMAEFFHKFDQDNAFISCKRLMASLNAPMVTMSQRVPYQAQARGSKVVLVPCN
jgi:hypothetical protein